MSARHLRTLSSTSCSNQQFAVAYTPTRSVKGSVQCVPWSRLHLQTRPDLLTLSVHGQVICVPGGPHQRQQKGCWACSCAFIFSSAALAKHFCQLLTPVCLRDFIFYFFIFYSVPSSLCKTDDVTWVQRGPHHPGTDYD